MVQPAATPDNFFGDYVTEEKIRNIVRQVISDEFGDVITNANDAIAEIRLMLKSLQDQREQSIAA